MNLPYIQSELFRQLVGMETLLKPDYKLQILRSETQDNLVKLKELRQYGYYKSWAILARWRIKKDDITTPDQITAEINRIWQEIPAECKRTDILK